MQRTALVGLVGFLAGCNQIFGLSQAHEGADAGSSGSNVDASCDGAAGCACKQGSDCVSQVCAIAPTLGSATGTGACADSSDVAYVSATGSVGAPCTQQQPCATITAALTTTTQSTISLSGEIDDNVSPAADSTITIYGIDDATISSAVSGNDVVSVAMSGANLTLIDVTIQGAVQTGETTPNGATVSGTGTSLTLFHCSLTLNAGVGVAMLDDDTLVVTRSTISDNGYGGLLLNDGRFTATNDFIVNNGTSNAAQQAAVALGATVSPLSILEYLTIAHNTLDATDATDAAGLSCKNANIPLVNSIVANNINGSPDQVLAGGCPYDTGSGGPAFVGSDSTNTYLAFVNPTANFRLTAASKVIGMGKMDGIRVDVDNTIRPQQTNMTTDLGANEYYDGMQ
jgi:hypothetical protein